MLATSRDPSQTHHPVTNSTKTATISAPSHPSKSTLKYAVTSRRSHRSQRRQRRPGRSQRDSRYQPSPRPPVRSQSRIPRRPRAKHQNVVGLPGNCFPHLRRRRDLVLQLLFAPHVLDPVIPETSRIRTIYVQLTAPVRPLVKPVLHLVV